MKKYKKILIFSLISLMLSIDCYSQYLENNPTPAQRIFWGGNIGLTFGTINYIELSPVVGYRITDRFSAGIGVSYSYLGSKQYNYSGYTYGGTVLASFSVIKSISNMIPVNFNAGLLIYAENTILNVKHYYNVENVTWVNTPLIGGALQLPVSKRSYVLIMLLFNLNETAYSQYTNPVVKLSFHF